MRRLAICAAAALTALALGLAHVSGAHADTYEVCGYGVSVGEPSACMTLADAIAAAGTTAGRDTIRMYPGSYCSIDVEGGGGNQGIDFVGMGIGGLNLSEGGAIQGSEAGLTTISWQELYCGSDAPSALATVNAFGRFTFRNLSFDGSSAGSPSNGIVVSGSEPTDLTLRDVLVQNMTGIGVSFESGSSSYLGDPSMDIESSAVLDNGTGVQSWGFASILSSTVAGNHVGVVPHGKMSLLEDTISHNDAGVDAVCCGNSMQAVNTLLAGNTTDCGDYADWEAGSLGSNNNIVGDSSCTNPKGADTPLLAGTTIRAVELNGGPTPSIIPPLQAEGAGAPNACSPDQREFVSSTGICDVGSVQQGSSGTPVLNGDPVDFGQIDPAVAATRSVSFGNGGGGQVDVIGVTLTGAGYTMVSDGCTHAVLVPGNFGSLSGCEMTVSLLPTAAGEWDGTITLSTTAGTKEIPLTAQAVLRPLGADDSYDIDGAALNVAAPGVLQNDAAGTTVDEILSLPSNGTLTGPNADGSFSYAPDGGFTGDDSFQYTILDGGGVESHPITVTLHVVNAVAGPSLYVNAAWAGIAPGVDPDAEGPAIGMGIDAFATIGDAISMRAAGARIYIASGTYDEGTDAPSIRDEGVELIGAGSDTTHVTFEELSLRAPDIVVQGLDIHGTGTWSAGAYSGSDGPVIHVVNAAGSTIRDCALSDSFYGVLAESGEIGFEDHVTVDGTDISHVVVGVDLDGVDSGVVTGNDIHDTGGAGLQPQGAILLANSEDVELTDGSDVSGNTVTAAGNIGVSIESGNNTISGNTIDASGFIGVKLDDGRSNTIDGNTISGTLVGAPDGQAAAWGGTAIVIGGSGAPATTITHNTLSGNAGWGILEDDTGGGSTGTVANQNDVIGNTLGGVENLDSGTLDATQNWWGDASGPAGDGPGSGATVSNASFDPWLACPFAQGDCGSTSPSSLAVTTTADSSDGACTPSLCSLRDAVDASNAAGGSTVSVPGGHYVLTQGPLVVTNAIEIDGAGARETIVDGGGTEQVVRGDRNAAPAIALSDLTITGGHSQSGDAPDYNEGGGIISWGSLTLTDVAVTGNAAQADGGGLDAQGDLTIVRSTIANNTAVGSAGGVRAQNSDVSIVDSTIASNTAETRAAMEIFHPTSASITSSTIVGNANTLGGWDIVRATSGTVTFAGDVIANQLSGGTTNCAGFSGGSFTSGGHNLVSDSSCNLAGAGDLVQATTELGSLGDNGGPTDTLLPQSDSPLVDAGGSDCPAVDQRGESRPSGAACDIGAVEIEASTPPANQSPVASFTSSSDALDLSVDASASTDSDGSISSYAWEFGDNASGTGATANHTYASGGTFTVTLTVTDDDGATSSVSHDITVAAGSTNQSPRASFTSSTNDLSVSVDASASSDADGTIATFAWDFGDGASATGATASHTYASGGTYTVVLTVTDDDAATADSSASVTVSSSAAPPTTTTTTTSTTPLPTKSRTPVGPPTVLLVSPDAGPPGGGATVMITGAGFVGRTQVSFGSVEATSVAVVSETTIRATAPQLPDGVVDVTVHTPGGDSSISDADKYAVGPPMVMHLSPSYGQIAGGTDVVITGSGFLPDAQVLFGTQPAVAVTYRSPNEIDATSPPSVPASVEVHVSTAAGSSLDYTRQRATFAYFTGSSFRPSPDGFNFLNYGPPPDSNMTGDDLLSLFGRSVCTTVSGACQLTSEAQTYLAVHNAEMNGGHCFGFAALSLLLWENGLAAPYLDRGALGSATTTFGLTLGSNVPLQRQLALAWNMTTLPSVQAAYVRESLTGVIADLQASFADPAHVPYVLIMWGPNGGGHAVTPYAYAPGLDPGTYVVLVYDNNYPDDTKLLSIDASTNTWFYPPYQWSGPRNVGGDTGVELVPTDVLVGQRPDEWTAIAAHGGVGRAPSSAAAATAPTAEIALTGAARNHPKLVVTDARGRRQGFIGGHVVSEIPGGQVVRLLGGIPGAEAEPLEHVPAGTDVTVRIDGSSLTRQSAGVAVSEIGPGFDVVASNLDVRPGAKSTLAVRGDGTGFTYTADPDAGSTPRFELARTTAEGDYRVEIGGAAVPAGARLTAALDPATLEVSVAANGMSATGFRVAITRRDQSGGRAAATVSAPARGRSIKLEARLPRLIARVKLSTRRVSKRGAKLSYVDSRPGGRVTILTQRAVQRRCRGGRRCVRWLRVRRVKHTDRGRLVSVRIGARLPAGRYRVAVSTGPRTTPWLGFTVRTAKRRS